MAYRKHYLLAFGGSLFGGMEQWQTSLRMARPVEELETDFMDTPGPGKSAENVLDDLVADIRLFFSGGHFTNAVRVEWVKFNRVGPGPLGSAVYLNKTMTYARYLTGVGAAAGNWVTGGTGTGWPAPQLALAMGLRTARQRGVGSKGRFFLPQVVGTGAMTSATDARMNASSRDNIKTAAGTFLNNLNNWPGFDANAPRLIVATPGGKNEPEGLNVPVTQLQVGRAVDTQQRRRRDLLEDYTSQAVN